MSDEELDIVELEDEDGNTVQLSVERYFYYNGDEYVLLSDDVGNKEDTDEVSHFVMKVHPLPQEDGEDMEEFVPVEEELMERLIKAAETTFTEDDGEE